MCCYFNTLVLPCSLRSGGFKVQIQLHLQQNLYLLEDILLCWSQGANQLTVPLTGWQVLWTQESSSVYSVDPPAVFSAPPVGQK